MATVNDVYIFESGISNSNSVIYTKNPFDEYNKHVERIESAMMEEFKCNRQGLKSLPRSAPLGPKAEAALKEARASKCFGGDPLSAMKAMAPRMADMIHIWLDEAKKKGAKYIVVGNDSFDYEDYPVYVNTYEEALQNREDMDKTSGIYFVKIVEVY